MRKIYPCIEVDLSKLTHNVKVIVSMCEKYHIDATSVTKVFCAYKQIVEAILKGGIKQVADSRILNLKKMEDLDCSKMLLRIPMQSEIEDVVKYSDVSLNSEIETIRKISEAAKKINKIYKVILMVDVGDLREGVLEKDVLYTVSKIKELENIELIGLGTNVTCYGGVIPDQENLGILIKLRKQIEEKFNLKLPVISGGNSSSLYMVIDGSIPEEVNQLRIGESIVLARETSYGKAVPDCYDDVFIFKGEVVECKDKPTIPKGNIGMDAFGLKPHFVDRGIRRRAIVAVGRQDVKPDGLIPLDKKITLIGASSDHLILDVTDCENEVKVGDVLSFKVDYGCLLAAMTSPYVEKYFK